MWKATLPLLFPNLGVFEQLLQLQWILADFLHGRQQEPVQRDVNHFLQRLAKHYIDQPLVVSLYLLKLI